MNQLLVLLLIVLCGLTLGWGLLRRQRFLTFPVLAALVYLGWVLPQAFLVVADPALPPAGVTATMVMAVLAFVAIIAGWDSHATPRRKAAPVRYRYDERRLVIALLALSALGAFLNYQLWSLPEDLLRMGQWSGPQTILIFFARVQDFALVLALLLWLATRRAIFLAIFLFNLAFIIEPIVLGARRAGLVELALIGLGAWWFQRRWFPSRTVLLAGAVAAALAFNAIGAIRSVTVPLLYADDKPNVTEVVSQLMAIDYLGDFLDPGNNVGHEMRNAVYINAAVLESLHFNFGTGYWDRFVHQYVPGQLVGFDLKRSLMFSDAPDWERMFGVEHHTGTTRTGFSDSFQAFYVFGAFIFFAIAYAMRWLFDLAERGELWAQYGYVLLITTALHAITHSTNWFAKDLPFLLGISVPLFLFARARTGARSRPARGATPSRAGLAELG